MFQINLSYPILVADKLQWMQNVVTALSNFCWQLNILDVMYADYFIFMQCSLTFCQRQRQSPPLSYLYNIFRVPYIGLYLPLGNN